MINPDEKVQAGDDLVEHRLGSTLAIVKVKHVTPTGQIVLTDERRFLADGRRKVDRWTTQELSVPTPELSKEAARQTNMRYLESVNWRAVDADKLQKIVDILNRKDV